MQVMYILQGVPGSGKSRLAQIIAHSTKTEHGAICSTDSYFTRNGVYTFDPSKLSEAHESNQRNCSYSLELGHSVIVDNTNIKRWQAKPYVEMAVKLNIPVVFIRVTSDFKTTHGVPDETVARMKSEMEDLSVESCLAAQPPVRK